MGSLEAGRLSLQPVIVRGRGKNKKYWNSREEAVLVEILAELNDTSWKTDYGYKNGYYFYIEKRMEEKLPGCGFKADPHIELKIKTFKRRLFYVLDIEENGRGFWWDDEQKMVVGNKDAFLSWAKKHEGAATFFMKPFVHFDKLCEIYGRKKKRKIGHALSEPTSFNRPDGHGGNSGSETQSNSDVKEDSTCIIHSTLALPPPPPLETENKNPEKSREFNSSETKLLETIRNLVESQRDLAMATINMNKASSYNAEITELRKKLFGVLMNLPSLSPMDVVKVARIIGQDDRKLEVFFSMPDDYKVMFAQIELASS